MRLLGASEPRRRALIACLMFTALGCGDEQTAPSVVGYSWEVQIGGTGEPLPDATRVEFAGIRSMSFQQPSFNFDFNESTPIRVADDSTGGALPPRLMSLEDAESGGVRFVAMSYCGFENIAGGPRDEDTETVVRAVELLLTAMEEPLRNAAISEESLEAAGVRAAEALEASLLAEFDGRALTAVESELLRDLRFRIDNAFHVDMESLLDTLPGVVSALADSVTERTLRGCGSLLFFDLSESVRNQEFPTFNFPGGTCGGTNSSLPGLACSLEAWDSEDRLNARDVDLLAPPKGEFHLWALEPVMIFTPLGP